MCLYLLWVFVIYFVRKVDWEMVLMVFVLWNVSNLC